MSSGPRYVSLQDYLRVIRRHRILIALVTVGFTVAALLISISQTPTYIASASLAFRDPLQDLGSIQPTDTALSEIPTVRSAQNAQLITRPEVSRKVKKHLKTDLSTNQLAGAVSASVNTITNFVTVQARSSDAEFAARLANTYADTARQAGIRETQQRLALAEESLRKQIKQVQQNNNPLKFFQVSNIQQQILRVEALRQISQPVRVTERASVPGAPVSPQTTRNVILGGMVGLFFGLLGAFLRDTLDRRLHNAHDAHEELDMPVLGRVSDTALGFPGLASNGRVPMAETDFEAFRVLRMNLAALNSDQPLRSVAVTSGLPEEGKSTVSMSLASAAALAGQRVLLVECDLRRPSFARRLSIGREPGLTDYLAGRAAPQEVLQSVDLSEPAAIGNGSRPNDRSIASFVCIVAGSPAANPAELLLTDRFRDLCEKVTKAYDLVIFDTSPLLATADALELVPQVDGVLVCVRVQQTTREEARAARAALNHVPARPMGAVVTGLRRGGPDSYEYYYYGPS